MPERYHLCQFGTMTQLVMQLCGSVSTSWWQHIIRIYEYLAHCLYGQLVLDQPFQPSRILPASRLLHVWLLST